MRALIILCEPRHVSAIHAEMRRHVHPQLVDTMTAVIAVDVERGRVIDDQAQLFQRLQVPRPLASDKALVVAPREVANKLLLATLAKGANFDLVVSSAAALTRTGLRKTTPVQSFLNSCGLSLVMAATTIVQPWAHAQIGREQVDEWLNQFSQLGSNLWIGKALLGQVDLKSPASLGNLLCSIDVDDEEAICVNREPRGNWKSADVLGNILTKRHNDRSIYSSPAEAIEKHSAQRVVLFEDGLWSGTEAVGILNSMLGHRDDRLKTARMSDPSLLKNIQVKLAYAVGTDYGQALVRKFLSARGLQHFDVVCVETVRVAQPNLLAQMEDPAFELETLLDGGPSPSLLLPHAFEALRSIGMPEKELRQLIDFCKNVGLQLFTHYIDQMRITKGWSTWPREKLINAATGMHGLGLTHAFGHSIPKACLPLLWAQGEVSFAGKRIQWRPLFANS